uniref:DUF4065 domain-containing protein n=1 Tax=Strongyloides venezuelensis TaxID=75913 RepID=A0A0K0G621_STRVS
MNRTIKYLIARDIKDVNKIKSSISLLHRRTCLNFSKSNFSSLLTAIRFIADMYGHGHINGKNIIDVIKNYKCNVKILTDEYTFTTLIDSFSLGFYPKRYEKNFYIIPETLKQRNYATELSLSDLKAFDNKIWGDECKDHLCSTYSNY